MKEREKKFKNCQGENLYLNVVMRSQSCQWLTLTVRETGGLVYVHHLTTGCHLLAPAIQSMKIQSSLPVMMNPLGVRLLARGGQGVPRPHYAILYMKATVVVVSICVGSALEDSSSHCPFLVELPQM